jgi:hypothetical protein
MEEIGPVDFAVVAFPGNRFRGEIGPALADLVDAGTIRIIDIAFAGKDGDGNAVAFELTDLDDDVQASLEKAGIEVQGLLNDEDLVSIAEELEPDSSAAVIVWENVWARKVTQAMRDAGGILVTFGRSSRPTRREETNMFMRRGPGLVRAAATTAVVAGTAGAVRHRQEQRYAAQDQAAYEQATYEQQAPMPQQAAAPAESDYVAELEKLAELKSQGILSEEEFAAKKAQLLGI